MIKLIVFDMDGTLLNNNKELPHGFFDVVKQLHDMGIKLGIGSGRQYQKLYLQMGDHADEFIYISDNGTLVYEGPTNIYKNSMDKTISDETIRLCEQLNCYYSLATPEGAYLKNGMDPKIADIFGLYYHKQIWVDNMFEAPEVCKISVLDLPAKYELIHEFDPVTKNHQVVQSGPEWIDMMNFSASKGAAIEAYQKENHITRNETMTFGDAMNDYEMMQQATYSFAMANAQEKVKEVSNFLTKSNEEDGVMIILRRLIENNGDPSCFQK